MTTPVLVSSGGTQAGLSPPFGLCLACQKYKLFRGLRIDTGTPRHRVAATLAADSQQMPCGHESPWSALAFASLTNFGQDTLSVISAPGTLACTSLARDASIWRMNPVNLRRWATAKSERSLPLREAPSPSHCELAGGPGTPNAKDALSR